MQLVEDSGGEYIAVHTKMPIYFLKQIGILTLN